MAGTLNLTKVDILTEVTENSNLIIEDNFELRRLNVGDLRVEVDDTLAQAGKAADAKAVGDALNSLARIIAVDDGNGNIELKPFITNEALIETILEGEY